jgi:hypothetical protein
MVPCQLEGERDDLNNYDGGTPGWEEFDAGTCTECGASDWTSEETATMKRCYQPEAL